MRKMRRSVWNGGFGRIARVITSSMPRILMYHRFCGIAEFRRLGESAFEAHLQYIKKFYRPVSLGSLVADLRAGRAVHPKAVVLTVDDGYVDFLEHAYPLLLRYEIPATVYLVSEFVSQRLWLWFDAVHFLVHAAADGGYEVQVADERIPLILDGSSRDSVWEELADRYLLLSAADRRGALIALQDSLQVSLPENPTEDYRAMTWDEVRSIDSQLVDFGAHSKTHPILSRCSKVEQREEIFGSMSDLERELGSPPTAFCYPNGQPSDYDDNVVDLVRHAGFSNAVVAHGSMLDREVDLYRLERLGAPHELPLFMNCLDGLWALKHRFLGRRTALL